MPILNGLDATRRIREQEKGAASSVLIFGESGNVLEGDAETALAAGMNGYFTKPYRAQTIIETIVRSLVERDLHRLKAGVISPITPPVSLRRVSEPVVSSVVKSGLFNGRAPLMKRSASCNSLSALGEVQENVSILATTAKGYQRYSSQRGLSAQGGLFSDAGVSLQPVAAAPTPNGLAQVSTISIRGI